MKTSSVMIVEDDARVRSMIRRIIDDIVSVYECANAEEAVALYGRIRPDLVLMDLRMEGVDGLSATRTIRAASPEARIIIVTSYDAPDLREAARQAGATDYVVKDDLSGLRAIVKRATESALLRERDGSFSTGNR
jgi:CheY-like chemotaxis protein